MSPCPTLEQIEEAVTGVLPKPEVLAHLELCDTCSALSEEIRGDVAFLHDVLRQVDPDGVQGTATAEPDGGDRIPGYRLLEEIHRGGQGVVYKAVQRATHRLAAVKVLIEGRFASPLKLRRFEREIELVSRMRHPHVVSVYDSGVTGGGRLFLAMEYVKGVALDEHLSRMIREEADPARRRHHMVELFAQICEAVAYAHRRGVIHRDLKPGNVLVDADGAPHVLDFGMAKAARAELLADGSPLTTTGEFMGTLAFASPEQVTGDPELVDLRTDVYSTGVMLYTAIAGRPPYAVSGPVATVVRAISDTDPEPPSPGRHRRAAPVDARPCVPGKDPDLDAITLKALAKDRDQRYQSAGELARDLRRLLEGEPVEARRGSSWYVLGKLAARHRTGVAIGAAFLFLLIAGVTTSLVLWRTAARALIQAERGDRSARLEAARAQQMQAFLADALSAVRPDPTHGPDLKIRDFLDQAAARLSADLSGEPQLEATLRETIAETYYWLGLTDLAEQHMAAALRLREAGAPTDPAGLVAVLIKLGRNRSLQGDLAGAEQVLRRAESLSIGTAEWACKGRADAARALIQVAFGRDELDQALEESLRAEPLIARSYGETSLAVASLLADRGSTRFELGQDQDASDDLHRAGSILRELDQTGSLLGATVMLQRCRIAWRMGERETALDLARDSLATLDRIAGPRHPTTLRSLTHLAFLETKSPEGIEERVARRLRSAPEQLDGLVGIEAAESWNDLGLVAQEGGHLADAESWLRRALALYDRGRGGHRYSRAVVMQNLGSVLMKRDRCPEAVTILREALAIQRDACQTLDRRLLGALRSLAFALYCTEHTDEAEPLAREALEIARRHYPKEHVEVAWSMSLLGLTLIPGDAEQAEDLLRTAEERLASEAGEKDIRTLHTRHRLAACLAAQGECGEAEDLYRELIDAYPRVSRTVASQAADVLNELGQMLFAAGDRKAALDAFEEGLERSRAAAGRVVQRVRLLNNVGAAHSVAGNDEVAERFILQAVAMSRSGLPPAHPDRLAALENLRLLCRRQARVEEYLALSRERCELLLEGLGSADRRTIEAIDALAVELERRGRDDEARGLRQRRDDSE